MTITWNADDLKVCYKDPVQITKFPCYLLSVYGEELKPKRGKFNDYLGMDINFSENVAVKVSMFKYVEKYRHISRGN